MRKTWLAFGPLLMGFVALSHLGCEVPPLMAPGASIFLTANPDFVPANGGVSIVTALLTEPAGTLVPDGTVVYFFTNLGRVDPSAKTRDGLARVNFVSDSRSGTANVQAFSGGGLAPAPTGTASPAPGGSGLSSVAVIRVGSALPAIVQVTADPQSVRGGGWVAITANVFDGNGNPVSNVPVIFSLSGNVDERLDSGGRQVFTDNNGQAFDTLRTRLVLMNRTVTVKATTPNNKDGMVMVSITL